MREYGKIIIKIDELIKKKGWSKNRFTHEAMMQHTQLNKFCKNQITQLDMDVLARICAVLECEIGDLLESVPPDKDE